MTVGHPHAQRMAEFAEDAARDPEPWRLWEMSLDGAKWSALADVPFWLPATHYRRKPRTIMIGSCEVPAPLREAPPDEQTVWVVGIDSFAGPVREGRYQKRNPYWPLVLARGLLHTDRASAEKNAAALLDLLK